MQKAMTDYLDSLEFVTSMTSLAGKYSVDSPWAVRIVELESGFWKKWNKECQSDT